MPGLRSQRRVNDLASRKEPLLTVGSGVDLRPRCGLGLLRDESPLRSYRIPNGTTRNRRMENGLAGTVHATGCRA